jgi:hypothetical protein
MSEMAAMVQRLAALGGDPVHGVYLEPPAAEAALDQLQAAAQRDLGQPIPEAYLSLLRHTNGVQINAAYFTSAEHLVAENLDAHQPEIIVLGTAGNVTAYVYDRRDAQFHTTVFGFYDERLESFSALEEMLAAVLHEQQVT